MEMNGVVMRDREREEEEEEEDRERQLKEKTALSGRRHKGRAVPERGSCIRGKLGWDLDLRWIHYSEIGREIPYLSCQEIYERIDVDGYGGRKLRDFCGGFCFVCSVEGKIFC